MFTEHWQKLRKEKKVEPEQLLIDYKEVFGTEAGKRVLKDLESKTTFGNGVFPRTKAIDPYAIVWAEAQRVMFVYILKMIHKVPTKKQEETVNVRKDNDGI